MWPVSFCRAFAQQADLWGRNNLQEEPRSIQKGEVFLLVHEPVFGSRAGRPGTSDCKWLAQFHRYEDRFPLARTACREPELSLVAPRTLARCHHGCREDSPARGMRKVCRGSNRGAVDISLRAPLALPEKLREHQRRRITKDQLVSCNSNVTAATITTSCPLKRSRRAPSVGVGDNEALAPELAVGSFNRPGGGTLNANRVEASESMARSARMLVIIG